MVIEGIHEKKVKKRRVEVLASHLLERIPNGARILDVGCGSGELALALIGLEPSLEIRGIDVLVRPDSSIEVEAFDGRHIPHEDASFDLVLFCDVLHHSEDIEQLLRDAKRVSRGSILIKDHTMDGLLAYRRLKFMDQVGNRRFDVEIPCHYLRESEWRALFAKLELSIRHWRPKLGIYPWPVSLVFDSTLQFIAEVRCQR